MLKKAFITISLLVIISGTISFGSSPLIALTDNTNILESCNQASDHLQLQQLSEMYADTLFISQTVKNTYNKFTSEEKLMVWENLAAKPYSDLDELQYAIYNTVFSAYQLKVNNNSTAVRNKSSGQGNVGNIFAGGDGTLGNPYQVSTPEQLDLVRYYLDSCFIQNCDIDLTDATGEGGAFYNDGAGWMPIGDDVTPFSGIYDGGNYRIIGININKTAVYAGLFGYSYGIIKNLGVVNGTIYGSYCVGGIVGHNGGVASYNEKDGIIINCYNTSTILTSPTSPTAELGGIAGRNYGIISSCYNIGTVLGSSPSSTVGGISADNCGTINECYNTGSISASCGAGGIAATNRKTITNSYNMGNISDVYEAAGISAHSYGTISNCYNMGNISAVGTDVAYAGGLVGYATTILGSGEISNGYSIGDVNAIATYARKGKVIGYSMGAALKNLYFLGTITEKGVGFYDGFPQAPAVNRNSRQLRTKSSLAGLDFENTWRINRYINDGYPFLYAVYDGGELHAIHNSYTGSTAIENLAITVIPNKNSE